MLLVTYKRDNAGTIVDAQTHGPFQHHSDMAKVIAGMEFEQHKNFQFDHMVFYDDGQHPSVMFNLREEGSVTSMRVVNLTPTWRDTVEDKRRALAKAATEKREELELESKEIEQLKRLMKKYPGVVAEITGSQFVSSEENLAEEPSWDSVVDTDALAPDQGDNDEVEGTILNADKLKFGPRIELSPAEEEEAVDEIQYDEPDSHIDLAQIEGAILNAGKLKFRQPAELTPADEEAPADDFSSESLEILDDTEIDPGDLSLDTDDDDDPYSFSLEEETADAELEALEKEV